MGPLDRLEGATRRGSAVALALFVVAAPGSPTLSAQQAEIRGPASPLAIDRWLISSPFPAQDTGASLLDGPGEEAVLPDRGRELAGATWTLVRLDGSAVLPLDSLMPDRPSPAVAYAHSYVRLPQDRTMAVAWRASGGAVTGIWINGRQLRDVDGEPLALSNGPPIPVRMGAGWNTLLFRVAEDTADDEKWGLSAQLATERGGASVRVQASRPPGDIRTGPEPWVIASPRVSPSGRLAWSDAELLGEVEVAVTAWSRSPVDEVAVRLRADGVDARGAARWLTPGTPVSVGLWIPRDRLERVRAEGREFELQLKWADEEVEQRIPGPVTDGEADPGLGVFLSDWQVRSAPSSAGVDRLRAGGPLPDAAGWTMSGKWEVPKALEGRDLYLDASASPGDFRVGDRAFASDDLAPLCSGCRKGEHIEILARSSAAWDALPRVVEGGPGGANP